MRYLVVILAGLAAFTVASLAEVVTVEQIIAKVNGEIITNIDLDHDRAAKTVEGQRPNRSAPEDALKRKFLTCCAPRSTTCS
jgi:hypothetical protein